MAPERVRRSKWAQLKPSFTAEPQSVVGEPINVRERAWREWQKRRAPNGPYPEFVAYDWLEHQGFEEFRDFYYQVPIGGGRTVRGGFVIDFVFKPSIAGVETAAEVYGSAFHTAPVFGNAAEIKGVDRIKRDMMERNFSAVVYISEAVLLSNPTRAMTLGLMGVSTVEGP